jgi:hypothetical protein
MFLLKCKNKCELSVWAKMSCTEIRTDITDSPTASMAERQRGMTFDICGLHREASRNWKGI